MPKAQGLFCLLAKVNKLYVVKLLRVVRVVYNAKKKLLA
jgi:hypothetical protein